MGHPKYVYVYIESIYTESRKKQGLLVWETNRKTKGKRLEL